MDDPKQAKELEARIHFWYQRGSEDGARCLAGAVPALDPEIGTEAEREAYRRGFAEGKRSITSITETEETMSQNRWDKPPLAKYDKEDEARAHAARIGGTVRLWATSKSKPWRVYASKQDARPRRKR